jgi:hypothetical protein
MNEFKVIAIDRNYQKNMRKKLDKAPVKCKMERG